MTALADGTMQGLSYTNVDQQHLPMVLPDRVVNGPPFEVLNRPEPGIYF